MIPMRKQFDVHIGSQAINQLTTETEAEKTKEQKKTVTAAALGCV